ncbi:type IV toxin-antitoxin system AbiEi family antitoxin domain-containing protein [Microbacterium sp. PM5]|uniref:type IV toxin-antitoxin system AbiEi family antitoxin domain-containing protein n=1 Tax=Microbacterium sp. PM5 TaxID=2014534 RepID=UPI0013AF468A
MSSRELRQAGMSRRQITDAVRAGAIIRARRDHYLVADAPRSIVAAVRVGGRLTCLSLLAAEGVFVFANDALHVHLQRGSSRLRGAEGVRTPISPRHRRDRLTLHWLPLMQPDRANSVRVGLLDALAHSVLCQPPRHAIATLDSALNRGAIVRSDLDRIFDVLPRKYGALRPLVDGRSQAGSETLVRLMVRATGAHAEPQVFFPGVGWVDLLVEGWLVIECDSRQFHSDWRQQVKDRDRDLALAAQGCVVLRVTAAQVFLRPQDVQAAIRALLRAHAVARPRPARSRRA